MKYKKLSYDGKISTDSNLESGVNHFGIWTAQMANPSQPILRIANSVEFLLEDFVSRMAADLIQDVLNSAIVADWRQVMLC